MTIPADRFPRLLAGMPSSGALGLRAHESIHGPLPLPARSGARAGHPLILELERAGLRGYGGAGFPTATKLRAVAAAKSRPSIVVNASEGEPLSLKDALVMRHLPHLVIDGAIVAATLLGGDRLVFALDESARTASRVLHEAVEERSEFRGRGTPAVLVAAVPNGYLTGQESALISALDGGPAKPKLTPPYPFERGLRGRPTLVSNAETFAQIGLVARYGAEWFRALGAESAPGTRLVTVGGAVAYPGVVELAGGTTLRQLLDASGGTVEPLRGVLVGGYAGTWLGTAEIEAALDSSFGWSKLGAGIVFALPRSGCAVAEVANVSSWLRDQSAGQCGPCVNGLGAIADALADLCADGDRRGAYGRVERWCELVVKRGACALPDGLASFVVTALHAFRPEFDDHARHGRCDACLEQRLLPAPTRDEVAVA